MTHEKHREECHHKQNNDDRVKNREPMDGAVRLQRWSSCVSIQPVSKRNGGFIPENRIGKLDINLLVGRNINNMFWIIPSANFNYLILVIKNIKSNVFKQVILEAFVLWRPTVFKFANKGPEWKIIEVHLVIEVIGNSIPESGNIILSELLLA